MNPQSEPFERRIQALTDRILADYGNERVIDRLEMFTQPDRLIIESLIEKLFRLVFPGYYRDYTYRIYNPKNNLSALIEDVAFHLNRQIGIALRGSGQAFEGGIDQAAEDLTASFLERLPEIRAFVETDLQAAYDGDPAACDKAEVIIAYPGLYAITVYRLAHVLYQLSVPLIPRIMTEYAHSRTGIDIHPGARIGRYFFIDHGTGVVIGETTTIGHDVKLYQHVTLGAKSFDLLPDGSPVKGIKRHPDIGDFVVIYAGATILGGDTRIGSHCVIGGNVWLTHSVPAGKTVLARAAVTEAALIRDRLAVPPLDSAML